MLVGSLKGKSWFNQGFLFGGGSKGEPWIISGTGWAIFKKKKKKLLTTRSHHLLSSLGNLLNYNRILCAYFLQVKNGCWEKAVCNWSKEDNLLCSVGIGCYQEQMMIKEEWMEWYMERIGRKKREMINFNNWIQNIWLKVNKISLSLLITPSTCHSQKKAKHSTVAWVTGLLPVAAIVVKVMDGTLSKWLLKKTGSGLSS